MGRNFAQIAILLFCFFLLYDGNQKIVALYLENKLSPREKARLERGTGNRFLFLTVKGHLPETVYRTNVRAVMLFVDTFVLQLVLGWFEWFGVPMTVLNVATVLFFGVARFWLSLAENEKLFGKRWVFFRKRPTEEGGYVSVLTDGFLFLVLPLAATVLDFSLI